MVCAIALALLIAGGLPPEDSLAGPASAAVRPAAPGGESTTWVPLLLVHWSTASANNTLDIVLLSYSGSDEYVRAQNLGPGAQLMSGWRLVSVVGDQEYFFPDGYILGAGSTVNVHSGPGAPADNPPGDLRWTLSYIWNNAGDKAELRDGAGTLVDSWCYDAGCP
jgi:hypothetical protein